MITYLIVYGGAVVLSLGATVLAIWLAPRIGAVDQPGLRKVHTAPIPRIGGLAILLAVTGSVLAAVALDYASLWVEGYVLANEDYGKGVLGVPAEKRLIAVLPIGKPAAPPAQAARKPLSEILHRERYGA